MVEGPVVATVSSRSSVFDDEDIVATMGNSLTKSFRKGEAANSYIRASSDMAGGGKTKLKKSARQLATTPRA